MGDIDDAGTQARSDSDPAVVDYRDFYTRFCPQLVVYLMHLGASRADADDIAADTMVAVWRRWDTISKHEAWARKVARHALGRRLVTKVEEPRAEIELGSHSSGVEELVARNELQRLLALLPPRQREVLALNAEGYTPADIAVSLHLNQATVRANLAKARRSIAIHLNGRSEQR